MLDGYQLVLIYKGQIYSSCRQNMNYNMLDGYIHHLSSERIGSTDMHRTERQREF